MKKWLRELTHKAVYGSDRNKTRHYKMNSRKFYAFASFIFTVKWFYMLNIIIIISIIEKNMIVDPLLLGSITGVIFTNFQFALKWYTQSKVTDKDFASKEHDKVNVSEEK